MNFDLLGKLTGWMPGAAGGGLLGGLFAWIYWSSYATGACPSAIEGFKVDCVHTFLGTFDGFTAFLVASVAVGGIIGALVNLVRAQLTKPSA